jgi:hypothetical protein
LLIGGEQYRKRQAKHRLALADAGLPSDISWGCIAVMVPIVGFAALVIGGSIMMLWAKLFG